MPLSPGTPLSAISTPALVIDLDAFERNLEAMRAYAAGRGIALRAHAKTHKSADIARLQMQRGGAVGVCCQKISEAAALIDGGVTDVLVSNQVTDPAKIDQLAALATRARLGVCVDDAAVVSTLAEAAARHGVTLRCLVEIDVGANRCGVLPGAPAVALAQAIAAAPSLCFDGLQAYFGNAQHLYDPAERETAIAGSIAKTAETVAALAAAGLPCPTVTGAGTGSFPFEAESGVYTELQCGSYIFMDADYARVEQREGTPRFEHSLFVLTAIMSVAGPGRAVCDAGHKVASIDSGYPTVHRRPDLDYVDASDEHGVIADPANALRLNDRLMLIPGHCDPTCNLHDRFIGLRDGVVETLWPVTARGCAT